MGTVAIAQNGFQGTQQGMPLHTAGVDWTQLSDAEIMLRVREGDDSGFSILIEKYRKQIVHFMFRMSRNQAVAEELAQEVFLRVYRSRQTYRAEAKFSTWLYRIATNLGVNHARDTKSERTAQNVYLDQPDAETGTTPDVADSALRRAHERDSQARDGAARTATQCGLDAQVPGDGLQGDWRGSQAERIGHQVFVVPGLPDLARKPEGLCLAEIEEDYDVP
jgi:RNA polymerase sigma factor (sigma-70 family)